MGHRRAQQRRRPVGIAADHRRAPVLTMASRYDRVCSWCGHPHHHGQQCAHTITVWATDTAKKKLEQAPCPCARHKNDEDYR